MTLGRCTCCDRRWRSADQKAQAERRAAIHRELAGGEPAAHLQQLKALEIVNLAISGLSRRDRHAAESQSFRASGESNH